MKIAIEKKLDVPEYIKCVIGTSIYGIYRIISESECIVLKDDKFEILPTSVLSDYDTHNAGGFTHYEESSREEFIEFGSQTRIAKFVE